MYLCKEPLFTSVDETDERAPQQLEGVNITIPISYTLFEQLHNLSEGQGSLAKIKQVVDAIIRAPLYDFPQCPLVFEREGISIFVPDDGQDHNINWKALILQVHISLLTVIGWQALSANRHLPTRSLDDLDSRSTTMGVTESQRGQSNAIGSRNYTTGSISLRQKSNFVASFSARGNGPMGSIGGGPSYESIQVDVAPQITRGKAQIQDSILPDEEIELNTICEFSLICSYVENALFRSIVLSVVTRGLLDNCLGYKLLEEVGSQLRSARITFQTFEGTDSYFSMYHESYLRTLLSTEEEELLLNDLAKDQVSTVLDKLDSLQPYDLVPHMHDFIENCLAPLCYHENPIFASRATSLYQQLLNEHPWDLKVSQVSTYDLRLPIEQVADHQVMIASTGSDERVYFTILPQNITTFNPPGSGFYDWCYVRNKGAGGYEIDISVPANRCIVLPASAKKEVIHELPAFDDKGPIEFEKLAASLEDLATAGVTAVHIAGALEHSSLYNMNSVTDHSILSKNCGGIAQFKELVNKAKTYGIRVLTDFTPLVSLNNSSRKYTAFSTLQCDERGRLLTASVPGSDNLLLNIRSVRYWDTITNELKSLSENANISGFFLGQLNSWDYALPRNKQELMRFDPDGQLHYGTQNIIQGSVVQGKSLNDSCGISSHDAKNNPFLFKMIKSLWTKNKDAFVWVECEKEQLSFTIESGLIPQTDDLSTLMTKAIESCIQTDDINYINAGQLFQKFFDDRSTKTPKNSLVISPFGSLTQEPYPQSFDALGIALNILFFLPDVPILSGCLDTSMYVPTAYISDREVKLKNKKWFPPARKFGSLLKERAATRTRADFALQGDCTYLPVTYDAQPMNAVISIARVDPLSHKCAIICMGFFMSNLIFEVDIRVLSIVKNLPNDSILEVKPILNVTHKKSYYHLNEVNELGASLFLEVDKFGTAMYELVPMSPPVPSVIQRTLMEDVFTRLDRSMNHNSFTVLAHNYIFNSILKIIEDGIDKFDDNALNKLIRNLPQEDGMIGVFRKALFFATRFTKNGSTLKELEDDNDILPREQIILLIMEKTLKMRTDEYIYNFGKDLVKSNALGPIFFIAPELGPFSKVGGLSTMVWELAKELVNLGLDIHVISPYYNINPKGETGYLKKYGIEYKMIIEVYCPNKVEIGIHYGVVDGVKCWFLHNYSYFATPYQTGSTSFRLQTLVLMARASLELCCQVRIIPSLVVTNDWMTGLTPAYARHSFGNVFNGTRFLHIFHNLGVGYAGKLWPSDGNVEAFRSIHQLPEELLVDPFDHSIDPSLCALLNTDQWATVSKQYRKELLEGSPYKYFLANFPKPFAYSNGIRFEERLGELKKLNMNHAEAKAALQKKYFGEADESKCVFVFVGRIVEQKGVYLIIDSFEELHKTYQNQLQFIVGGQAAQGDTTYGLPCTQRMVDLKQRYPQCFWADPSAFFSDGLLACQGADYTLVPSLFEPSGIVQQESFCSGTPVIAFRTGGLADTVFEFDKEKLTGNGFSFWAHRHRDYSWAVQRAYDIFKNNKELYNKLRQNAYESTLSTDTVARAWAREFARLFTKVFEPPEELSNLKFD